MSARLHIYRLAIFGLLLSRAPRWVPHVVAFALLGVALAVALIVLGVAAHGAEQRFVTSVCMTGAEAVKAQEQGSLTCADVVISGPEVKGCEVFRAQAIKRGASAGPCRVKKEQIAPEYNACHAGDTAACKRWRVRACRDGNPAPCDYDEAQKQSNPFEWCAQRYPNEASQYRFCLNGSPDR